MIAGPTLDTFGKRIEEPIASGLALEEANML
jgi:hypothetical protein